MLKLKSAIENNAMILGGVGIGVALIQVSSNLNCPLALWFEVSSVEVYIKTCNLDSSNYYIYWWKKKRFVTMLFF